MTKKNKSSKKTQIKNFIQDFEDAQERKLESLPISLVIRLPPQVPASDVSSSVPREKHNKKSIRPPVLFHREHEEPHGYLSQWYISSFTDPTTNQTYNCTEQYMMHHKALFRDDLTTAASILATPYPKDQKALGRCVANWDDEAWDAVKEKVFEYGSYLKFSQNKDLKERLLMMGERELVEASASDRVWGFVFNAKSALSKRDEWGSNLLGKCLMSARERVKKDEAKRVST